MRSYKATVKRLAASRSPHDKALHIAALVGEVEIAKVLLDAGCQPNRGYALYKITNGRSKPKVHHSCVLPLHFAIAAQHLEMIGLLQQRTDSFHTPTGSKNDNLHSCAPARWVLLEDWLRLVGCSDPIDAIKVVDTLRSGAKRRDINSSLNGRSETLLDFANALKCEFSSEFKATVITHLRSRGAKTKAELFGEALNAI